MAKRIKTNYPGVYYREARRIGKPGVEKVYYIVFKKDGKMHEEKAGRQFMHAMTPAKAANLRGERIEGRRLSPKQLKEAEEAKRLAEMNRWTIERLWNEYKARNPGVKGIVQDENRFKNHVQPHFGNKEPKEITPLDVDRLRVNLLKEKKEATVQHILELLRRITMFGKKKQLCEGLSFTIEMPKVNNEKTEDLSPDELTRLLAVLDDDTNFQIATTMKLALFTGLRRGELLRLQWSDIDYERGFILIRNPKGGETQRIPLNEQARLILKNHPKTSSPFIFPGRAGKQRHDIKKEANRIKKRAGLPESFRALHGLRHVYASLLASSGKVDMYTLQKLLTHKSSSMTQRYAHLHDQALKKAANLGGNLIEEHKYNGTNGADNFPS